MSDNIPFEIQTEIIKRLPIKSLIQCRSVSKLWKSLIDSSKFIADYHHHTQRHHLLVSYTDLKDCQRKYVSIVDDDTFPQQKAPLNVPMSVKLLDHPKVIGSSQGLFCFYSYLEKPSDSGTKKAVIWNPSIRKSVDIPVLNVLDWPCRTYIGFGVSPQTCDPKLVKITYDSSLGFSTITSIPWLVEVFSLSSGAWRSLSTNLPSNPYLYADAQVNIDGFIYWLAIDLQMYILIISFDTTTENLTRIHLPDCLTQVFEFKLVISKLRASLVLLEANTMAEIQDYGVWMMEDGVPNLFTKLFTIRVPNASIRNVLGFQKSGQAIIEMVNDVEEDNELLVCESYSERIDHIGISGERYSFFVSSYRETLLLLDH